MAGTLVQIRFIRAYKSYRVGDKITPNGTLRQYLVEQGYAEVVEGSSVDRQVKTAPGKRGGSKASSGGLFTR